MFVSAYVYQKPTASFWGRSLVTSLHLLTMWASRCLSQSQVFTNICKIKMKQKSSTSASDNFLNSVSFWYLTGTNITTYNSTVLGDYCLLEMTENSECSVLRWNWQLTKLHSRHNCKCQQQSLTICFFWKLPKEAFIFTKPFTLFFLA